MFNKVTTIWKDKLHKSDFLLNPKQRETLQSQPEYKMDIVNSLTRLIVKSFPSSAKDMV